MRRSLALIALGLPLAGCVVEPNQPYGYGYSPAPGYAAPPAYSAPGYPQTEEIYPGYAYNEGSPYITVEGAALPLIFFGGSWGYYDGYHRFQRAPDRVWRHLEEHHPRGYGVRPYEGGREAPRFGGGGRPEYRQAPPQYQQQSGRPAFQALPQGGRPEYHQAPPTAFAPPQHQAPPQVAAPPVRAQAPVQPQHQEHRGDHRCPPGQQRC